MEKTTELVSSLSSYVNSFNDKGYEFCKAMSTEHRTLQQRFTKLCLQWIEHCASEEYRTDARNEQSKDISKILLDTFREYQATTNKLSGYTLEIMSTPSRHLGTI